jgi:hypothetical protein
MDRQGTLSGGSHASVTAGRPEREPPAIETAVKGSLPGDGRDRVDAHDRLNTRQW